MKILVTGARGFIGKNLIAELRNRKYEDILEYNRDSDISLLEEYAKECDFVFHLAGINRSKEESDFINGNCGFTSLLFNKLIENDNNAPVLVTSSIQAELDNVYGKSKKSAEEIAFSYAEETGSRVMIYRLPNVFGKWCKPNYNSVVATFCNNIANDLDISINDSLAVMNLVYIDDVVNEFINSIEEKENKKGLYCFVPAVYTETVGKIAELIKSFKQSRINLEVPNMNDEFEKKLYSTYLSYLPKNKFSYPLNMNIDNRGSFTEFLRTNGRGQVSVNITKPGITKGNHWHHTKNEKFLVVSGSGLVSFRQINSDEIIEYYVTGDKLEVIDIPTGYTHNIINKGDTDMVTIMWANEAYNPERPDTYYLEV